MSKVLPPLIGAFVVGYVLDYTIVSSLPLLLCP